MLRIFKSQKVMDFPLRWYILSILLIFNALGNAYGATFTYPGVAPCNTTLQACIDATLAGDIVEIATNTAINESPNIDHSLTLRPATGSTPALAAGNQIIAGGSGATNNSFTIQGITLQQGNILVGQGSTGTLTANILNNVIVQSFTPRPAISVSVGNLGPIKGNVTFSILNNRMTVPFDSWATGIAIQTNDSASATGVIGSNVVVMQGSPYGAAIDLANGSRTLTVDVIGNTVSGTDYDSGISLSQGAPGGTITARVINNLITGQNGNAGGPAAIGVYDSQGTLNFAIINNTVANNRGGILIGGRTDLGAVMNGDVANNIIADNIQTGLSIDPPFESTVTNSYNLVFGNGASIEGPTFTPGPGTLFSDPRFVGAGNYHLQAFSPAVNAGSNAKVPVDITTDLDRKTRIFGSIVDMGAFEVRPVGLPWLFLLLE
jgi:hypothetical protein